MAREAGERKEMSPVLSTIIIVIVAVAALVIGWKLAFPNRDSNYVPPNSPPDSDPVVTPSMMNGAGAPTAPAPAPATGN